jgi:hypothetical protein
MTVVVKNDTLRDIETRAATTRLDSSFCSKRNLDSSAFAKEGNALARERAAYYHGRAAYCHGRAAAAQPSDAYSMTS